MNTEMAYLLGMICGNGTVEKNKNETKISISIPHKKLRTDEFHDVKLYVKASLDDINKIIAPLLSTHISIVQLQKVTLITFVKPNQDYTIREMMRLLGGSTSRKNMRIPNDIFSATELERKYFLKGLCDVTAYIRRSNYYFEKYKHRVYIEIPNNWYLVIDIANLLKTLDIPIQNIDWAHPNMRDGFLRKYNSGNKDFWKKEHQIKIWANEFRQIGFGVRHKELALNSYTEELLDGLKKENKDSDYTHKFYWEGRSTKKRKPIHPEEYSTVLPPEIRGKHYESWKDIARDLGYGDK
ncbi:TPA: hypothetical protein U0K67_002056 [Streptococcus suis]|nr:hypothetical protein [Streptococcus suis]